MAVLLYACPHLKGKMGPHRRAVGGKIPTHRTMRLRDEWHMYCPKFQK
jgi:hypothetical protein